MIGQHPELAALPELKLFAYETIGELEASLPPYWTARGITHRSPGLVRAIAHFEFGGQTPGSLTRARDWLRERAHWTGADVGDFLLERLGPRAGVEKSPENVETDEAFERLTHAYPRARYLHLARHPISTQRSMEKHLHRTVPGFSVPGQPMTGIAHWVATHRRILSFTSRLPQHAFMLIKAEDVLNDPDMHLRRIAAWLRIRCDSSALNAMRHPEASPFAYPAPPETGIIGGNDPDFLRHPIPHPVDFPPALDRPPGWVGNPSLWESTVDLASQLGYR